MQKTNDSTLSLLASNHKFLFPLMLLCAVFMAFWQLDLAPAHAWDEARYGANAAEMLQKGDYINYFYHGRFDDWNAKPPLMIWLIALSYKIFGFNTFALRFPSALAIVFFFGFAYKWIKIYASDFFAIIACLMTMACKGVIAYHVSRTGDYDAIFTLFLMMTIYFSARYIDLGEKKAILWAAVSLGLTFYTKGFAFLLIVPAIFTYLLIRQKITQTLKDKYFYFALIIFLSIVISWFLLLIKNGIQYQSQTYGSNSTLERMIFYDIGERFFNSKMSDVGRPYGYDFFIFEIDIHFNLWNYLFYLACLIGLVKMYQNKHQLLLFLNEKTRLLTTFSVCISATFVFLLTISQNKCDWYLAPIIIYVAVITLQGLYFLSYRYAITPYLVFGLLLFTFGRNIYFLQALNPEEKDKKAFLEKYSPIFPKTSKLNCLGTSTQDLYLYSLWWNIKNEPNMKGESNIFVYNASSKESQEMEGKGLLRRIGAVGDFCIGEKL